MSQQLGKGRLTMSMSVPPSRSAPAAAQGQPPSSPERFELGVTDLRESTWKDIPEDQRRQEVKIISGVEMKTSLAALRKKVKHLLKDSRPFLVCNPDKNVVDDSNFTILKNGDQLILLDDTDQELPLQFSEVFSTAPHSKAVTSQKGAYHGTPRHNVAAFALADLVDNSLSATAGIPNRRIEIKFLDNAENPAIHVLDNGRGMSSESLKLGLIYKAPKVTRRFTPETHFNCDDTLLPAADEDSDEEAHPLHLNSNISMFGAGMKKAVFFLGQRVIIMTKKDRNNDVLESIYSTELLEKNETSDRDNAWKASTLHRKPGIPRDEQVPALVRELIVNEEPGKTNFTHLAIDKLDRDILELLAIKEDGPGQEGPSIEKQLAHIYHYYIHGRCGNIDGPHERGVNIIVTRVDSRGNSNSINLADIPSERLDLESQFVRTSADDFLFTIECTKFNNENPGSHNPNRFKVGGIIRYHPYLYSQETIPSGAPARKNVRTVDAEEENGGSTPESEGVNEPVASTNSNAAASANASSNSADVGPPRKCEDFFNIWWNGRLVPLSQLPSFNWCSPGSRQNNDKRYDRISGSLFFDANVDEITDNKLNMSATTKLLERFNEKKFHTQQSAFQRVTRVTVDTRSGSKSKLKAKGKNMRKDFEAWLTECQRHDKQVVYSELMSGESKIQHNQKYYYPFKGAVWNDVSLRVGDIVKMQEFSRTPNSGAPLLGRVVNFLVLAGHVEGKFKNVASSAAISARFHTSLSYFTLEPLPTALYVDKEKTVTRKMGDIDLSVGNKDVLNLLKEIENGLRMKVVINEEKTQGAFRFNADKTKLLDPIPLDGTLFQRICLEIRTEDGAIEVKGVLANQARNKNQARKEISMVARIFLINDDGTRELYHTSDICPYYREKEQEKGRKKKGQERQEELQDGYYFKAQSMSLKQMEFMSKPGKYLLTFRSYVDVDQNRQKERAQVVAEQRERRLRSARPSSPVRRGPRRSTRNLTSAQLEEDDLNFDVEWEQEVDSIGRKILVCHDGTKIRMPFHDIEFDVVAGLPTTVQIEQVGEDEDEHLQVGVPFPILLSFEDGRQNKARPPENLDSLRCRNSPTKPLVTVISTTRTSSGLNLKCSWDGLEIDQDFVRIKNVRITGQLGGSQFKDIRLGVNVCLDEDLRSLNSPVNRILVGRPRRLNSLKSFVEVESGDNAKIECQVLDGSDNIIVTEPEGSAGKEGKPIMLKCDFYRENDTEEETRKLFTCNLLVMQVDSDEVPQTTDVIDVQEFAEALTAPVTVDCILSYKDLRQKIKVHVKPSAQPSFLKLYEKIDGAEFEILHESETNRRLGESLNLVYKLFDGLGNLVPFDQSKHKLDFPFWPKKKCKYDQPNAVLRIPTKAKTRRKIKTVAEIQLPNGKNKKIKHRFYFNTKPAQASKMEAFLWDPVQQARQAENKDNEDGEPLQATPGRIQIPIDQESVNVSVCVADRHGNTIQDGMDLEYISAIRMEWDGVPKESQLTTRDEAGNGEFPGSFLVKFKPPSEPGDKDIRFALGEFECTLKFEMLPGKPTGLAFEIDGVLYRSYQTIPIRNMTTAQVRVHLVDKQHNPTAAAEPMAVSIELGGKNRDKWPDQPHAVRRVDIRSDEAGAESSGVADFGNLIVGVASDVVPGPCTVVAERCDKKVCFQLQTLKATVKGQPTNFSTFIKFHVAARTDVPKLIKADNGGLPFSYVAGSQLDKLKVSLIAEDRTLMTAGLQFQNLSLYIAPICSEETENDSVAVWQPSEFEDGKFTFERAIESAGVYKTKFVYSSISATSQLEQPFENIVILSDEVHSLQPAEELRQDPIFVSAVADVVADRTIVANLKLVVRDRFGNNVNQSTRGRRRSEDMAGTVVVELMEPQPRIGLLRLEQHGAIIGPGREFRILNGEVTLPSLVVAKNSQLGHDSQYLLRFTATLDSGKSLTYNLRFNVLNNILQHEEIKNLENCEASYKRGLAGIQTESRKIGTERHQLVGKLDSAEAYEHNIRTALVTYLNDNAQAEIGQPIVDVLQTVADINQRQNLLRRDWSAVKAEIKVSRTAKSNIDASWENREPVILGQIGRLAEIKSEGRGHAADTRIQCVLSWALQSELDTVVVTSKARARTLSQEHRSTSFMMADILRDHPQTHQNWNEPIPEDLLPFGHPVHARSLLLLPPSDAGRAHTIRKVFRTLLGDTVMVDTMEDATDFMEKFNQLAGSGPHPRIRGSCPRILTRDGQQLTTRAVIGGSRNTAPERITNLKFRFGLGPNLEMELWNGELKQLDTLKAALEARLAAWAAVDKFDKESRTRILQLQAGENDIKRDMKRIQDQLRAIKGEAEQEQAAAVEVLARPVIAAPAPQLQQLAFVQGQQQEQQQQPQAAARGRSRQLSSDAGADEPSQAKRVRQ